MTHQRCGRCRQPGHNRITCGKTAPAVTPTPPPRPSTKPQAAGGEPPAPLDLDDIHTWWMLISGNTGKRGRKTRRTTWVEDDHTKLVEMLHQVLAQGTPTPVIKKFLGLFGLNAIKKLASGDGTPPSILSLLMEGKHRREISNIIARRQDAGTFPAYLRNKMLLNHNIGTRNIFLRNTTVPALTRDDIQHMWNNPPMLGENPSPDDMFELRIYLEMLAEERNCPPAILQSMLARDKYTRPGWRPVTCAVFTHAELEPDFLAREYLYMVEDEEMDFAANIILSHRNTPRELVENALTGAPYTAPVTENEQHQAKRREKRVAACLENPAIRVELIVREHQHPTTDPLSPLRGASMARNPNTPLPVLREVLALHQENEHKGSILRRIEASYLLELLDRTIRDREGQ